MKNKLYVDVDSERTNTVLIGKPPEFQMPKNEEEHARMVCEDIACLCEALCTLIHLAEHQKIRPSAESLRICIKHLTDGFADPDYKTIDKTAPHEPDSQAPPLPAHE